MQMYTGDGGDDAVMLTFLGNLIFPSEQNEACIAPTVPNVVKHCIVIVCLKRLRIRPWTYRVKFPIT